MTWFLTQTRDSNLSFFTFSCFNSSFFLCSLLLHLLFSSLNSALWSKRSLTQLLAHSLSFLAFSTSLAKQSHWWFSPCNTSFVHLICFIRTFATTAGTGLPRVAAWGDWPGSRKGTGIRTESFQKMGQKPFVPEPFSSPLAEALILIAHRTSSWLCTYWPFLWGWFCMTKVWLRMIPFNQESISICTGR